MSLADRIDALRRQHAQRLARPRDIAVGSPLRQGGRYARWQVDTSVESDTDGWLLSYLDLITLLLAILVVLLGVAKLPAGASASVLPVQLVGSLQWASSGVALAEPDAAGGAAWPMAYAPDRETPRPTTGNPTVLRADSDDALPGLPTAVEPAGALGPIPARAGAPDPAPAETQPMPPLVAPGHPAPADTPPEPALPSIADLGLDDLGDGVDIIVNEKTVSFRISNELLFPSGQSVLSDAGLAVVRRMAAAINRNPEYPVSVEGHSDPVPINTRLFPSNWELSAGRATSVLRALVRDGVDPARLRAVGYADTHPLAPNDSDAGRAANRRVELIMEIAPRREQAAQVPLQESRRTASTRQE